MAKATINNAWLQFHRLDYGGPLDGAFSIGYRLLDNQNELWSRRFLRAKDGQRPSIEAAKSVLEVAIPQLLAGSRWRGENITFTPAVRSRERTAAPSGPLATLAQHCATICGGHFAPQLISKDPHESLHRPPKSVPERMEILGNANFSSNSVSTRRVIVVDDLITSGLTLSYSTAAIKRQNREVTVYGLALGKHEYLRNLDDNLQADPNQHIPAQWNQLWQAHDKG